jgi:hypothetical protein
MIFPFIESEIDNILCIAVEEGGKKKGQPTALCTLRLQLKLRVIILQDAAKICVRFPSRKDHPLFRLPLFCSPEFVVSSCCFLCLLIVVSSSLLNFSQSYVVIMQVKLAMLMNVVDTSLEANLPETQRQLNQLHLNQLHIRR